MPSKIIDFKPRQEPHFPRPGLHLEIRGISQSYGALKVLQELDLDIQAGEFVAIVGRSGCGKSTLLRLIAGLEPADAGEVRHDGASRRKLDGQIRFMFQDSRLLPWRKVIANVGVGLKGNWREPARLALAQVGLEDREKEWPSVLSGGQKQRVALARALVSQPKLLLLDEPLGALDALTRIEMQNLIESLWLEQGFTALLVTHDVSEAVALADRIILLEQGAVGLDLKVPLPRSRERGTAEFAELERAVLGRVLERNPPGDSLAAKRRADTVANS
ncbi:MAG: ATP-binding cassette domain-containing protein [Methylococcaceae bacterium]|nr:ATP-binding cassette domain-containing protein [Methylococcaceae bacterium]